MEPDDCPDDWLHRSDNAVVINGEIHLSPASGRVDILAPMLPFEGESPGWNLVLDMHYSLNRPRAWKPERLQEAAAEVVAGLEAVPEGELVKGIAGRLERSREEAEEILRGWKEDFALLARMAGLFDEIVLTRNGERRKPDEQKTARWMSFFDERQS